MVKKNKIKCPRKSCRQLDGNSHPLKQISNLRDFLGRVHQVVDPDPSFCPPFEQDGQGGKLLNLPKDTQGFFSYININIQMNLKKKCFISLMKLLLLTLHV